MRPESEIKEEVGMKLTRFQTLREFPVKILCDATVIHTRVRKKNLHLGG